MPRITRKQQRNESQKTDITVASAILDISTPEDSRYLRGVIGQSRGLATKAWSHYDEIGEVHYAVSRGARVGGYAKLGAYKVDKTGQITKQITSGAEAEIAEMLYSPYGGQRGLIERYISLMKVPGDAYLIRMRDASGNHDGYDFISSDEIERESLDQISKNSGKITKPLRRITLPLRSAGGVGEAIGHEVKVEDFLGRVWRPSQRWIDLADSPLLANDIECEILTLLTKGLRAKILSRFAMNGIMYIPSEVNELASGDNIKADGSKISSNKTLDRLVKAAIYQMSNMDDAAASLPIFMVGPGEQAENVKHITYDREIFATDMQLRGELIDRILMGLDVEPQGVKGVGDSNHWSASFINDSERRVNIQPDLEILCWAMSRMVMHAELQARDLPAGRITSSIVWYDLTEASVSTNKAEDARQASDRLALSDDALRKYGGFDDRDKPTDEEYVRMLGVKVRDPYLATFGLPIADKIDWDKVAVQPVTGPTADSPGDKPKAANGGGAGGKGTPSESDTPRRLKPA
jgi:hypothetical protein